MANRVARARDWSALAATCLVSAVAAVGVWHVAVNRAPPRWDDAHYLACSFRLFHALSAGPAALASEWASILRYKAPLICALPLPLYAAGGVSERLPRLVGVASHAAACGLAALAALGLWARHPRRREIAALGASLTALTPIFYGISRHFMVEAPLAALVCAFAWRLSRPRPAVVAADGALLGLGLLAKVVFPALVAGMAWMRRSSLRRGWRPALLIAAVIACTWYPFNLPHLARFAWSASYGQVSRDGASDALPIFTFHQFVLGALSNENAAAWGLVLAAALFSGARRLDDGQRFALAWLLPAALWIPSPNREPRYLAPLLPALALLTARAAMSFETRAIRATLCAVLLGCGGYVFVRDSFLLPAGMAPAWTGRPSYDAGWDRAELARALEDATGDGEACLAHLSDELNTENLSLIWEARGRRRRVWGPVRDGEVSLRRMRERRIRALVLVDGGPAPFPWLAGSIEAMRAAAESGRLPVSGMERVALVPGVSARVLRLDWGRRAGPRAAARRHATILTPRRRRETLWRTKSTRRRGMSRGAG